MKKLNLVLCLTAAVSMLFGCTRRYADDTPQQSTQADLQNTAVTTESVSEEVTEPTTEAEKITTADDFKGYWNPVCIIENDTVNENYYNEDIPLDYLVRLYIADSNGTLYVGNTFENSDDADEDNFMTENPFKWNYDNGMLTMNFDDGRTIIGKMKDDTLIITDGSALKIYFNKEMEFNKIDSDRYIRNMCGDDVAVPPVENLFSDNNELSEEDVVGKWECVYYSADGMSMDNFFGIPLDEFFQLEVTDDKKAVVRIGGTDEDAEIIAYTWEINENGKIILSGDDGEFSALAVISDGEFCIEEGTDTTRYRKTEEFKDINWDAVNAEKADGTENN